MKKIIILLLVLIVTPAIGKQASIESLRFWAAPDHTRLVFDTNQLVSHTLFTLKSPNRLVVDITKANLRGKLPAVVDNPYVKSVRSAQRKNGTLRVVLDLKQSVKPKSFVLRPNKQYKHRLVIDLYGAQGSKKAASKPQKSVKSFDQKGLRDVVIAIDAGHGGEDPGAKGRRGTYEKNVVMAIAKKLDAMLAKEPGMKPLMVRRGDYYIGLRKRMRIARDNRADLFISIHADAFRDSRARGSSVYTLSRRGASSEAARWLAEKENSSDLVGGVKLEDKDDVLASVLLDLSQTGTGQASHQVADAVFSQLKKVGHTHKRTVQQAGFAVLKSPDVPSILVETAFISNPKEERNLRDPAHQKKIAKALLKGIKRYFSLSPPPGTYLAKRKSQRHIIGRGDTLGAIAQQYNITLVALRSANRLNSDRIRIGQVLTIPGT